MFIAGHVIQGLCTSLLLIAAVPPLAIGYPANKLRDTAVIMNMCIFGAVALGPFIGGLQAESNAWRPLFWIVAGGLGLRARARRADLRGRAARQSRLASRPAGDRARGDRLPGRLLRRLGAHEPRLPRRRHDPAAARRPRDDRRPGRLPVPRQAAAADDPHDAHELDPGRGNHRGAVRGGGLGLGDRAHRRRPRRALQRRPHRAALRAGARRRRDLGGRARPRHQQARAALPARWSACSCSPPASPSSASRCPPARR